MYKLLTGEGHGSACTMCLDILEKEKENKKQKEKERHPMKKAKWQRKQK
jgi:hypothetical protein